MTMADLVFYVFGAAAVLGSFGVATQRNPLIAAAWLLLSLFGVAGLFAAAGAHFLAAMQVLVYAGAVTVLFVFVIMLLNLDQRELGRAEFGGRQLLAMAAVLLVLIGLSAVVARENSSFDLDAGEGGTASLGKTLLGSYAAPFEIISLLFIAALAGAVMLTKRSHEPDAASTIRLAQVEIDRKRKDRAFRPDENLPSQHGPPARQEPPGPDSPRVGIDRQTFGPGETL